MGWGRANQGQCLPQKLLRLNLTPLPPQAFLRLRPALEAGKTSADPYILVENDTDILMKPPQDVSENLLSLMSFH